MIDFLLLLEVVPLEWLQYYDERELELIICGMQERVWNRARRFIIHTEATFGQCRESVSGTFCRSRAEPEFFCFGSGSG